MSTTTEEKLNFNRNKPEGLFLLKVSSKSKGIRVINRVFSYVYSSACFEIEAKILKSNSITVVMTFLQIFFDHE